MALTLAQKRSRYLQVAKASISAGDAVLVGANLLGVAMTDTDANGNVEIDVGFEASVHNLSVLGADNAGNAAVAIGDFIYDDSGTWNVDSVNGVRFGIALEAVNSGATTTIKVLQLPNG